MWAVLQSVPITDRLLHPEGLYRKPKSRAARADRQIRGRAMVTGCGVPSAGIWRGDFSMLGGDGEVTWNNGPGASSLSPSARKSGRQIAAGTPLPAQPTAQPKTQPKRQKCQNSEMRPGDSMLVFKQRVKEALGR